MAHESAHTISDSQAMRVAISPEAFAPDGYELAIAFQSARSTTLVGTYSAGGEEPRAAEVIIRHPGTFRRRLVGLIGREASASISYTIEDQLPL